MAVGTPINHAASGAAASTHTTGSFTPQANSLLYAFVIAFGSTTVPADPTISDSLGGTWTAIHTAQLDPAANPRLKAKLFRRTIGAAPAAMTITVNGVSLTQIGVIATSVTGASTDVSNVASNGSTVGDPTPVLAAMAGTSAAIGWSGYGGGNQVTHPTGYTELTDVAIATSRRLCAAYDLTAPAATLDFVSTNATGLAIALEIKDAAAASGRTATAAQTEAPDTQSAAGKLALKAASTKTEAADTQSAAGVLPIKGRPHKPSRPMRFPLPGRFGSRQPPRKRWRLTPF